MKPETIVTETSASGLPEWVQIALLLAFVGLLVLRFWIEPWKIGGSKRRKKTGEDEE